MSDRRPEQFLETRSTVGAVIDPDPALAFACELDEPRWSVVSFDKKEGCGLTYAQAAALMSKLDSQGVSGLCLVTNEAATKIK